MTMAICGVVSNGTKTPWRKSVDSKAFREKGELKYNFRGNAHVAAISIIEKLCVSTVQDILTKFSSVETRKLSSARRNGFLLTFKKKKIHPIFWNLFRFSRKKNSQRIVYIVNREGQILDMDFDCHFYLNLSFTERG